MVTLNDLS